MEFLSTINSHFCQKEENLKDRNKKIEVSQH